MDAVVNDTHENKIKYLPNLILKTDEKPKPDRVLHERYWTSWEEQKLLELWCKYFDEVIELDDKYPIFRTIAEDMKEAGFQLTTRECRRRMATLRNKYLAEKRRLESVAEPNKKSTYRLFSLFECFLEPDVVMPNVLHENEIVDEVLAEVKEANPTYLSDNAAVKYTEDIFQLALARKRYTAKATRGVGRPINYKNTKFCILPIRRVTPELLEDIRFDIKRLEQERDNDLKRLRLEQNDYYHWVSLFEQTQRQLEDILLSLRTDGRI